MTREEKLKSLKQLVKFYEENPDLEMPYVDEHMSVFLETKFDLMEVIQRLNGKTEKYYSEHYAGISIKLGAIRVDYICNREKVCVPKKIETVTVPARPEHTYEKVVEWECMPMLEETGK